MGSNPRFERPAGFEQIKEALRLQNRQEAVSQAVLEKILRTSSLSRTVTSGYLGRPNVETRLGTSYTKVRLTDEEYEVVARMFDGLAQLDGQDADAIATALEHNIEDWDPDDDDDDWAEYDDLWGDLQS